MIRLYNMTIDENDYFIEGIASDEFMIIFNEYDNALNEINYTVVPVVNIRGDMLAIVYPITKNHIKQSTVDKAKEALANKLAYQTISNKRRSRDRKVKIKFWENIGFTITNDICDKILCDVEIATLDGKNWFDIDMSYRSLDFDHHVSSSPASYRSKYTDNKIYVDEWDVIRIRTDDPLDVQVSPMGEE